MKKKKQPPKRPRFEALSVALDEKHINPASGQIEVDIAFDLVNGESKLLLSHSKEVVPPESLVTGYFGEKKMRTLSKLPVDSNDFSYDLVKKLKRYDRIVAIDTNSDLFENQKINLGIALHVIGKINQNEIEWTLIPINQFFVILGDGDQIENRNWRQLINFILQHKSYDQKHKIGIIVDSDLGEIKAYNNKTKPIIENFYLPDNFELIYASDRSADSILNMVIRSSHSISKEILEKFIQILKEDKGNSLK